MRAARAGGCPGKNRFGNFARQHGTGLFELYARGFHFRGQSFLRGLQLLLRRGPRRAHQCLPFVHDAAPDCLLLDENFSARLPQRFVIGAQLLLHGNTARFRFLTRAYGTLVAFGQNALKRPKKTPAQKKIKKENENDGRNCRQKQIAELV